LTSLLVEALGTLRRRGSECAAGPSYGSTRPWRASVRCGPRHFGDVGGAVPSGMAARYQPRPRRSRRPMTSGSRGTSVRPFRWRRCLSGPRPAASSLLERGRSHELRPSFGRATARLAMHLLREMCAGSDGPPKRWAVGGTSNSSSPSGGGANRRRACFRALFAGAFGHQRARPPVTLEHRCRPFGAERWVATDSSESGRDEAGDRAPSGETGRLRGAPSGLPRRQDRILRDPSQARPRSTFGTTDADATDPGLSFGATGRTGSAAVFGLPASWTGGRPSFGMVPASGLSEPDKPRSCLPHHSRVEADAATAWNRPGGTTCPDGRVGASCAADIRTSRSKAHGSIGPDRAETS
jgi:hypothetical protein